MDQDMLTHLFLSDDSVQIQGEYYTVSNGFVIKMQGTIQLRYKDLLEVEFVMHRSKKLLYAMLIPAGIVTIVMNLGYFMLTIAIPLFVILMGVAGALYLFSARRYIEFTTMRGTYRIADWRGDSDIENTVAQLQRRIVQKV